MDSVGSALESYGAVQGDWLTWSFRERERGFDEFEGFASIVAVMIEGGIERAVLLKGQDGQSGVAQQGEVLGSFGATQRTAVFPPHGGVALPVVEVFNAPVLADDGGKLLVGAFSRLDTGDEVTGFGLGLPAILGSVNAGATQHLAGVGKGADVRIEGRDAQVALFDAPVAAFELPGEIQRAGV